MAVATKRGHRAWPGPGLAGRGLGWPCCRGPGLAWLSGHRRGAGSTWAPLRGIVAAAAPGAAGPGDSTSTERTRRVPRPLAARGQRGAPTTRRPGCRPAAEAGRGPQGPNCIPYAPRAARHLAHCHGFRSVQPRPWPALAGPTPACARRGPAGPRPQPRRPPGRVRPVRPWRGHIPDGGGARPRPPPAAPVGPGVGGEPCVQRPLTAIISESRPVASPWPLGPSPARSTPVPCSRAAPGCSLYLRLRLIWLLCGSDSHPLNARPLRECTSELWLVRCAPRPASLCLGSDWVPCVSTASVSPVRAVTAASAGPLGREVERLSAAVLADRLTPHPGCYSRSPRSWQRL